MNEWNVVKKIEFDVNDKGDFVEVSSKEHPSTGEIVYGISKGWKNLKGFKKYKSNIILSKNGKDELISHLQSL
ncbi:MAG: hypothetical protein ACLFPL_03875 [Candidatus Nanoarchaeia archaeon]